MKLSPLEKTFRELSSWLKTSAYSGKKIYTANSLLLGFIDVNPYDTLNGSGFKLSRCEDLKNIQPGAVVVWDELSGTSDSGIPEDSLLSSPNLKLVNYFRSQEDRISGEVKSYDCWVMTATGRNDPANNYSIKDSLIDAFEMHTSLKQLISLGFEEGGGNTDTLQYSATIRHNGKFSYKMDGSHEFSPGLCAYARMIPDSLNRQQIRATVYIYIPSPWKGTNTFLVISLENKGQSYFYQCQNLTNQKLALNRWNKIILSVPLPDLKSHDDILKVFIWNPNKEVFFMDDLRVDLIRN